MTLNQLKKLKLPDEPGVYFFKNKSKIIYIGKATSLKDRVRSYFSNDLMEARGPKVVQMVEEATTVTVVATASVLEALLREAALIKRHQPYFNTREKDDKSFWYVVITNEEYPRILLERGTSLALKYEAGDILDTFGPFPSGLEIKEALKIIRRIFPYRDKCLPATAGATTQPCFNRQLGLCPGVCSGEISAPEYKKIIKKLRLILGGDVSSLLKQLETEMKQFAKAEKFEGAAVLRNQIFSLTHIKDVSLIKRQSATAARGFKIEAYDIAHLGGQNTVGVMTVLIGGAPDKSAYRRFKLKGAAKNQTNDTANLKEILRRRLTHAEWTLPDLMVVDGSTAQLNAAAAVLEECDLKIELVAVTKDARHKPVDIKGDPDLIKKYRADILHSNAEAHRFAINYHRNLRDRVI